MVAGGLDQCGEGVKEGVEVGRAGRGGGEGEREVGGRGVRFACGGGAGRGGGVDCVSVAVVSRELFVVVAVVGADVVRGATTLAA